MPPLTYRHPLPPPAVSQCDGGALPPLTCAKRPWRHPRAVNYDDAYYQYDYYYCYYYYYYSDYYCYYRYYYYYYCYYYYYYYYYYYDYC